MHLLIEDVFTRHGVASGCSDAVPEYTRAKFTRAISDGMHEYAVKKKQCSFSTF